MSATVQLTIELERAALRAIKDAYENINGTFFRWELTPPSFLLLDPGERLGCWSPEARALGLSRTLLLEHGWGALLEVLKHEMAHQYLDEVLGILDESSHGSTFRRVCAERGFDSKAAGLPAARVESPILDRVAKLLALAQSANQHEAQAAMSAAQRLMLKHNIEAISKNADRAYTFRHLGEPASRVAQSQRLLAGILSQHFFVDVIWVPVWRPLEGKRGSVLEVCGTEENVDLSDYAHAFLTQTAERLWREHNRGNRARGGGGRRSYLAGVMSGFREKLEGERKQNASQGLVWVGDPERERYFRSRHPRLRWGSVGGRAPDEAYVSGRAAGRKIVFHRGIQAGPSSSVRFLGPA